MAKTKQELLNEADKLGLNLSIKNTIAEIQAAITEAENATTASEADNELAETEKQFAKSGKRSAKAAAEAEEAAAKEARKEAGDTTPQDPNDEPASVLLERIRARRAADPTAKRGRRPKLAS